MSTIIEKIKADHFAARKAREQGKVTLLTTVLGEADTKAKNDGTALLSDDKTIRLLKSFIDNMQTVITNSEVNSLRAIEAQQEISILEQYMPQQLTSEQLDQAVTSLFTGLPEGKRKIGDLMGLIKRSLEPGTYDGAQAAQIAKRLTS